MNILISMKALKAPEGPEKLVGGMYEKKYKGKYYHYHLSAVF